VTVFRICFWLKTALEIICKVWSGIEALAEINA